MRTAPGKLYDAAHTKRTIRRAAKRAYNAAAVMGCQCLVIPVVAVAYCHSARRDEGNGYRFTAAMEWRKAAELLNFVPVAADRCWRHWERLMRIPRHLARPVGGLPCVQDAVG